MEAINVTVQIHGGPQQFLDSLAGRDFTGLAGTMAADAQARFLLPHGLEEYVGPDAIVGRIQTWFGSASEFTLTTTSNSNIGSRHLLQYRFDLVRGGQRQEIEQLVLLDLGPNGIEQVDLMCSGFHAQPESGSDSPEVFDAGTLGCADGLAQEFRQRIKNIPIGGSLEVVVSDPAAKEDLPSLARLLGQRVISTQAQDDGRLAITVERQK